MDVLVFGAGLFEIPVGGFVRRQATKPTNQQGFGGIAVALVVP